MSGNLSLLNLINEIGELNGLDDAQTTELYIDVDNFIDEWFRKYEADSEE